MASGGWNSPSNVAHADISFGTQLTAATMWEPRDDVILPQSSHIVQQVVQLEGKGGSLSLAATTLAADSTPPTREFSIDASHKKLILWWGDLVGVICVVVLSEVSLVIFVCPSWLEFAVLMPRGVGGGERWW